MRGASAHALISTLYLHRFCSVALGTSSPHTHAVAIPLCRSAVSSSKRRSYQGMQGMVRIRKSVPWFWGLRSSIRLRLYLNFSASLVAHSSPRYSHTASNARCLHSASTSFCLLPPTAGAASAIARKSFANPAPPPAAASAQPEDPPPPPASLPAASSANLLVARSTLAESHAKTESSFTRISRSSGPIRSGFSGWIRQTTTTTHTRRHRRTCCVVGGRRERFGVKHAQCRRACEGLNYRRHCFVEGFHCLAPRISAVPTCGTWGARGLRRHGIAVVQAPSFVS